MNRWRKLTHYFGIRETADGNTWNDKETPQQADFLTETNKRRLIGKHQLLNDVLYNRYGIIIYPDGPVLQKEAMEIKI